MGDPSGSLGANIQRTGSSPNFSYSVAADWANRPVNYVSFWDAARFANWLHNGQPTGPQGPGTTEGGAYHQRRQSGDCLARKPGAKFFIPTERRMVQGGLPRQERRLGSQLLRLSHGNEHGTDQHTARSGEPREFLRWHWERRLHNRHPVLSHESRRIRELPPAPTARSIKGATSWSGTKRL